MRTLARATSDLLFRSHDHRFFFTRSQTRATEETDE
jgi:hypothetical protein